MAINDQDTRAAVLSLQTSLRALQQQQRNAETAAAQLPAPDVRQRVDPAAIDQVIQKLMQNCDRRQLELAISESTRMNNPDTYSLFCMMVDRPELQRACTQFASEWLAAKADLYDRT